MSDQRQNFYKALSLVNSSVLFVIGLFLLERLNLVFLLKLNIILFFLIVGCMKVYCMSGLSGCLLEIISSEELVVNIQRFHRNAKSLWPGFLVFFVIVRLVDFFLFALRPLVHVWGNLTLSLLGTIGAYILARWTIDKKYIKPLGLPHRRSKFNPRFLTVMILACFLELFLVGALGFIHYRIIHWQNILDFIINYIRVFEFIFCSLYIINDYPEINEKFSFQKEIFVINPMAAGIWQGLYFWRLRSSPPFFVVLKALSPKTYKFREFNRVIWHERYYKSNVLVCITCFTANCYEAYRIAREFKKRGSKVIMGGPHVTYLPDEALMFCDSVVIGEAEGVWREVIRDYENGTLKPQYRGTACEADYAQVHQELLNSPPRIIKEFLETTRGCKFKCHFCSIPALSNGQTHLQPISTIVELIKKVKHRYSTVVFIDNNIYSNPSYAKELFLAIKPLKIKWYSQCSIDIAKNQETLKLARESGCTMLLIGYEVSSGSLEKNQKGKFVMAQKYLEYTNIIKKTGIKIQGNFIFGFDSDNFKTLFSLWRFCFLTMPLLTVVSLLTPLPGTGVYRDMLIQDRIINLNWRNYALNSLVFWHPRMNHKRVSFFFIFTYYFFLITTSLVGFVVFIIFVVYSTYFRGGGCLFR